MNIQSLSIKNFKSIRDLNIQLDGRSIYIVGKNQTGKTTLIQALYSLLTGKELPPNPVSEGEQKGLIEATLHDDITNEDITATLKFSQENTKGTLSLVGNNGQKIGSPRTMLENLTGGILFDPFDFIGWTPKKQVEFVRKLMGLNFDALDKEHKEAYDKREELNREIKALKGHLEKQEIKEDEYTNFKEKRDVEAQRKKLQTLEETNNHIRSEDSYLKEKLEMVEAVLKYIEELNVDLAMMQSIVNTFNVPALNKTMQDLYGNLTNYTGSNAKILAMPKGVSWVINTAEEFAKGIKEIQNQILDEAYNLEYMNGETTTLMDWLKSNTIQSSAELSTKIEFDIDFNNKVEKVLKAKDSMEDIDRLTKQVGQCTDIINRVKSDKVAKIAESKFPMPGLGMEEDYLTLDGLPFEESQISKSRIIKAGIDMVMCMNPKLKICRVKDGSLLDKETLKELIEGVHEQGYQLFVEIVDGEQQSLRLDLIEEIN